MKTSEAGFHAHASIFFRTETGNLISLVIALSYKSQPRTRKIKVIVWGYLGRARRPAPL